MRIFAGIVLILSITACNEQEQQAASDEKKEAKTDSVKVFVLGMDSAKKMISLPGELLPDESAQIRSKALGYIRKLNADIGSKVKKGQILALIDAPEINSHLQELNEKVRAAQSRYLSSKDYFDRLNTASKADGVIAPSELEKTKNQMMADSSEYKAASFAASSYRQVGDYLAVVAPYSGIITKRNIVVGSFVGNPNEKPLFELENNTTIRLQVAVPEIYTNAVLANNSGELTTRSLPDQKFKAKLVRKSGSIDNDTRSEVWEFEIPNSAGELKSGSYADVKLQFLRLTPSFGVPVSAIVTTLERKFVIKVSEHSTQWVDVRTGFNMGEKQEIFGDLHRGDTLVLKGNEELKQGTKVNSKL
ncbi:MAG: efflux transporter, family, subunit [Chitinophagaceae bacterium]|nr:efflux transporter, family, subunit [Chitinophagaceae bacterium]